MDAEHTPGPFLTEYNTIFALMHHGWKVGVEQFRNRFWANVHFDNAVTNEERKATMDLLKSAPDLLEALKRIREIGGFSGLDHLDSVAALIAKAEGKPPA